MKAIVKIVCCSIVLGWMAAAAAEEDPGTGGELVDGLVATPPAPRIAVEPYHNKVDRATIEKRMADRADRNRKRSAEAEKDAAERAAQTQQNAPQGNQ